MHQTYTSHVLRTIRTLQFEAITNKAAVATAYEFVCKHKLSFLSDKCTSVELLGHVIIECLTF